MKLHSSEKEPGHGHVGPCFVKKKDKFAIYYSVFLCGVKHLQEYNLQPHPLPALGVPWCTHYLQTSPVEPGISDVASKKKDSPKALIIFILSCLQHSRHLPVVVHLLTETTVGQRQTYSSRQAVPSIYGRGPEEPGKSVLWTVSRKVNPVWSDHP